ncbi:MAG: hypothetical protein D6B25_09050 [Desulfobulbaceae bacterium]|nr:MAG: hypothetical protein D6B25_09050 [Desulfobulbaceae bacterium]
MIENKNSITIKAQPAEIYEVINTMPNKFPIYRLLETKPFLFLRVLLFDGYRSALEAARFEQTANVLILDVGDCYGPFTLIEKTPSSRYWFRLDSLFFNCSTGYTLTPAHNQTTLNLDLIAAQPSAKENLWWFFAKPAHVLFTKKVLKNIKVQTEAQLLCK